MAADLSPGRWSALLVGAWWPARPDAPMAGVTYWREAAQLKRDEANDLRNERSRLAVNQGRTADDLLERYWRGEQRLATIAHQCEVKSDQSEHVADTANYLRDRLTEIAQSGNQQIDQILASKKPIEARVTAVNAVIERSNIDAANAGRTAMSNIIDATQRVLDETIGGDAHTWLRDHGVTLDTPARPRPITAEDLNPSFQSAPAFGIGQVPAASAPDHVGVPPASPAGSALGAGQVPATSAPYGIHVPPVSPPAPVVGAGQVPAPSSPPGTVAPPLPPSAPAVGVGGPSVAGAAMPPAAATAPLSPQSLGQSFTTGMTTNSGPATAAGTTAEPTYTAAETAAAHQKLCEVYKLAARAVQIQTHSDNQALGVAGAVNGALMLDQAVNAAPALTPGDRAAALALAEAYTNANAVGSYTHRDDLASQAVIDDVIAKDARMKAACGGG